MLDLPFGAVKRRKVHELNIVPILDMLTAVIFFLLIAAGFQEFNKLTLPPSGVETITDPVKPPPLGAKIFIRSVPDGYQILLTWIGIEPGQITRKMPLGEEGKYPEGLREEIGKLIKEFISKYPMEKTIQVGLGIDTTYQNLITVMDAVHEEMPDVVLVSYHETEARFNALGKQP